MHFFKFFLPFLGQFFVISLFYYMDRRADVVPCFFEQGLTIAGLCCKIESIKKYKGDR